jgi:thiamine-monophosphate kinase
MRRPSSAPGRRFSERAFHRWLAASARGPPGAVRALADDVAVLPSGPGALLLTTDAFVEGVHFLGTASPRRVGSALAEANLSDLASKGARPVAFLLDLLVPPRTPMRWAREAVRGVREALRPYRAELIGGDTKPARERVLVGSALGRAARGALPARHRARPGDLVVVTGTVGRGGLAGRSMRSTALRTRSTTLPPRARVVEGERLAPFVHAMIDTSDGAFESAHLVAAASAVAIVLEEERMPLSPELRAVLDRSRRRALVGYGGDYELFATLAPRSFEAARRTLARVGCPLTRIGWVVRGRGARLLRDGRLHPLPRAGWDPFRPRAPGGRRGPPPF